MTNAPLRLLSKKKMKVTAGTAAMTSDATLCLWTRHHEIHHRFTYGCLVWGSGIAVETLRWVQEPQLTLNEQHKNWIVTFELDSLSDVEVAIVDSDNSTVVRHLAAGVLGPMAPPPLISNSRVQEIEWDGRDD